MQGIEKSTELEIKIIGAYWTNAALAPDETLPGTDEGRLDSSKLYTDHRLAKSLVHLPYFVARDDNRKEFILSVRGTKSLGDALADLKADADQLTDSPALYSRLCQKIDDWDGYNCADEDIPEVRLACHAGMLAISEFTIHQLEEHDCYRDYSPGKDTKVKNLFELLRENPEYRLVCTGHSLGAGVASTVALILASTRPELEGRVKCWAFCPPQVHSRRLSHWAQQTGLTNSIIMDRDLVPRLGMVSVAKMLKSLRALLIAEKKQKACWCLNNICCCPKLCGRLEAKVEPIHEKPQGRFEIAKSAILPSEMSNRLGHRWHMLPYEDEVVGEQGSSMGSGAEEQRSDTGTFESSIEEYFVNRKGLKTVEEQDQDPVEDADFCLDDARTRTMMSGTNTADLRKEMLNSSSHWNICSKLISASIGKFGDSVKAKRRIRLEHLWLRVKLVQAFYQEILKQPELILHMEDPDDEYIQERLSDEMPETQLCLLLRKIGMAPTVEEVSKMQDALQEASGLSRAGNINLRALLRLHISFSMSFEFKMKQVHAHGKVENVMLYPPGATYQVHADHFTIGLRQLFEFQEIVVDGNFSMISDHLLKPAIKKIKRIITHENGMFVYGEPSRKGILHRRSSQKLKQSIAQNIRKSNEVMHSNVFRKTTKDMWGMLVSQEAEWLGFKSETHRSTSQGDSGANQEQVAHAPGMKTAEAAANSDSSSTEESSTERSNTSSSQHRAAQFAGQIGVIAPSTDDIVITLQSEEQQYEEAPDSEFL